MDVIMIRFLDIVFSILALLCLAPVLLLSIIVLRFTGEGEVFYVQPRVGKGGRHFGLLKFATMIKNSANLGSGTVTAKNDSRILPLGHFFRATKINELPQLFNILYGHMSVIGPRPLPDRCFNAFPLDAQREIIKVRPGLSGIASIVFRDEGRLLEGAEDSVKLHDEVLAPYKAALETWYIEKRTLGSYFFLILLTAWVVVFPKSKIIWKVYGDLPQPPAALKGRI